MIVVYNLTSLKREAYEFIKKPTSGFGKDL